MEGKRFKASADSKDDQVAAKSSGLINPFRTIGLVTSAVPISITTLGRSPIITTVVGCSFQIYDASSLHLLFISQPQTDESIDCVQSHHHFVFAAWGKKLGVFRRGLLQSFAELDTKSKVKKIIVIGNIVCALTSTEIFIYNFNETDAALSLHTKLLPPPFLGDFIDAAHLPTQLNKLVVASADSILIYSIKTGKVFHIFERITAGTISMIQECPVALDVVAVVDHEGNVGLLNIKKGKHLLKLSVGEAISTVSFRTDGSPMLGVGTPNGDLFFYNLDAKRRVFSMRGIHRSPGCSKIEFLPGAPVLVSAGKDNTLLEVVFDPPLSKSNGLIESPPRILRQRGGHSKAPSCLEFIDEESHFLLSGSADQSLWQLSLRKDSQNHQFSQKDSSGKSKMDINRNGSAFSSLPPIVAVAQSEARQKDWDSILTCHKNETFARSWNGQKGKLGVLRLNTADGTVAKSICISDCGNFALVGSIGGSIAVYNMQSGLLRRKISAAHTSEVTGVAIDARNKMIISSSLDGFLKIFKFRTGELIKAIEHESPLTELRIHTGSSLVASCSDDMDIVVVDLTTHKVIRNFWGHGNRITSIDFTPDGRSLLSASLDSSIRVWDIPSGGCIEAVRIPIPATVLRVAPNGNFLVTAHVSGPGIQVWNLISAAETTTLRLLDADDSPIQISMPTNSGAGSESVVTNLYNEAERANAAAKEQTLAKASSETADDDTSITFFPQGLHKFSTLINLDTIRERNKPKELVKKSEPAPFFLSAANNDNDTPMEISSNRADMSLSTEGVAMNRSMGEKLSALLRARDFKEYLQLFATMGPSAAEIEIRSLDTTMPYTELILFFEALMYGIEHGKDYDLLQAWLSILYKVHGDVLVHVGPECNIALEKLLSLNVARNQQLNELAQYCSGVLTYLRRININ